MENASKALLIAGAVFGAIKLINKKTDTSKNNTPSSSNEYTVGNKYDLQQKALIACFSHTGNTLTVASLINRKVEGDMFNIQTEEPYSYNYDETLAQAKKEKQENARPKLSKELENLDEYSIIFLGYPIWLDSMPMAIYTFLDTYDLSGKTIIPFCTSSSSGLGNTVTDIEKAEPNANVLNGLSIQGSNVGSETTKSMIDTWLTGIQSQLEKK